MNEFDKLTKLAERYKSMYPTGTRIEMLDYAVGREQTNEVKLE